MDKETFLIRVDLVQGSEKWMRVNGEEWKRTFDVYDSANESETKLSWMLTASWKSISP